MYVCNGPNVTTVCEDCLYNESKRNNKLKYWSLWQSKGGNYVGYGPSVLNIDLRGDIFTNYMYV